MNLQSSSADSFYVSCSFMSSKDVYYPDNKPNEFRLKFCRPLVLEGYWKVCICDINFTGISHNTSEETIGIKYLVNFSSCDGLYIDGLSTNTFRCFPRAREQHLVFKHLFYMPVNTVYLNTCELEVQVRDGKGKLLPITCEKDKSIIYISLHFKRFGLRR